jgi:hypothetical protein
VQTGGPNNSGTPKNEASSAKAVMLRKVSRPWIGTDNFDVRPRSCRIQRATPNVTPNIFWSEFEQAMVARLAADQVERLEDREPGRKPRCCLLAPFIKLSATN